MKTAVTPPVAPMLARPSKSLPTADGLFYEPKWDGFRCIVFFDGDEIELGSRNEKPLTRYFPEVLEAVRRELPPRVVLDGEIVIAAPGGLDFNALLQRIHPAASRIARLASETPASFVAFDLLAVGEVDMRPQPFSERRRRLEEVLSGAEPPVHLTPITTDPAVAEDWFCRFEGAGLDGVVCKPGDLEYLEDKRVMTKLKHERTADCVVAGFRWHASGEGRVGSLLLGLFDSGGTLQHVGVTASFTDKRRLELAAELEPYRKGAQVAHPWLGELETPSRVPGARSRWNAGRDLSFEPLRPELVCEVAYDHLQGDRFRHATTFRRWRPEREPSSCRYDQLDAAVPSELAEVFSS